MKKLLFLIILFASFSAKCDTLGFYHVYWNDSVIAKFNSFSEPKKISLKLSEIKETDVISVSYGSDMMRINCTAALAVMIEVEEDIAELTEESGSCNFKKISIPLRDLLFYRKNYDYDKFLFYYKLQTVQPDHEFSSFLFTLEFE